MKIYFVDTNIFLRFILKDHAEQYAVAEQYFSQAQQGKIKMHVPLEVVLEIEYVLRSHYKIDREVIVSDLQSILQTKYFIVEKRELLLSVMRIYQSRSFDITDIVLFLKTAEAGAEVLSFDKDLKKLNKL